MKNSILTNRLTILVVFLSLLIAPKITAFSNAGDADAIVGVWKTGEGNAMVRIYKNGDKYQGKIVWLKEPVDPETGKGKVDKNNSDEAARKKPVLGLINI
jgi:uncharacterized protein (DUF2147 family)